MNFSDTVNEVSRIIARYHERGDMAPSELIDAMRLLSTDLAYLETERSNYHEEWTEEMNRLIGEGESVSGAKIKADLRVPGLYMLRRVMHGADKVFDAMRSHLSYLKTEINQMQ